MKLSKKKSFRVTKGISCGERSPYWEWLEKRGATLEDGTFRESSEANADVLPDKSHMFSLNLSESDHIRLDALTNCWHYLSDRERQVIEWYGHEGKTIEQTANIMRISISSVRCYLIRASRKIRQEYKKLK